MKLSTRSYPSLTAPATLTALATAAGAVLSLAELGPWLAPSLRPWAHGLCLAWLLRGFLWLHRWRQQQRAWTVSPVWELTPAQLPLPAAGMFLGNAFPWTGNATQFLETALAIDRRLPVAQGSRGGFPVLHAVGQHAEAPLAIPESELATHTLLTGTTGSGKSTLLKVMAFQAIHRPGATIFLNPKGGHDLLAFCAVEARRAGKPFRALLTSHPAYSHTMNVLGTAQEPAEVAMRISAMMPPSGSEPFFREYPLALLGRIAAAQHALQIPWTLEGLYRAATMQHELRALLERYLQHLGGSVAHGWKRGVEAYRKTGGTDLILDALANDMEHEWSHFQKITASLNPSFNGVIGMPRGHLFSSLTPEITWDQITAEQQVVYIDLASLLYGEIAQRIGRMVLQDLLGYVGRRYAFTQVEHEAPLTILIDEVARVVYPQFPMAVGMSRGAGVRFILARQSFSDFEATLDSQALARQIEDNCSTQVYFRMASETNAQEALTAAMDTAYITRPEDSTGIGYAGVGGLTGHAGRRQAGTDLALIRPSWLTGLPRGEAFVRLQGQLYKLRIPWLTPITRQDLEAAGLVEMLTALPRGEEQQKLAEVS